MRRRRWWAEGITARTRAAALALDEDARPRAYRGIDGEAWPDELPVGASIVDGLADIESWPAIREALAASASDRIYDVLVIARSNLSLPDATLPGIDVLLLSTADEAAR